MADEAEEEQKEQESTEEPSKSPSKKKTILVLIGLLVLFIGAGGGGAFFFWQKQKARAAESESVETEDEADEALFEEEDSHGGESHGEEGSHGEHGEHESEGEEEQSMVSLEPAFTVNLGDAGGKRYAKIAINLELASGTDAAFVEKYDAPLRDSVIMLLSSKNHDEIATLEGKTRLKAELLRRVNAVLKPGAIKEVYFTEFFIVQY